MRYVNAQTPHLMVVWLLILVLDLYVKTLHGYRNLSLMLLMFTIRLRLQISMEAR